jgi:hypothetical protein
MTDDSMHSHPSANPTEEESKSDDGSEYGEGDAYFPIEINKNGNSASQEESYDPKFMEEDGNYESLLGGIKFDFKDLAEELTPPVNMYNGHGPSLRHGVASRFNTLFECVSKCGGMDYKFFNRITANLNEYTRCHMDEINHFVGGSWSNISVQEMIRFHGIILRKSLEHRELGGYVSLFTEPITVHLSKDVSIELEDLPAWGFKAGFPLCRFKQIRAAFHPEVGTTTVGDKRKAIMLLTEHCTEYSQSCFLLNSHS